MHQPVVCIVLSAQQNGETIYIYIEISYAVMLKYLPVSLNRIFLQDFQATVKRLCRALLLLKKYGKETSICVLPEGPLTTSGIDTGL